MLLASICSIISSRRRQNDETMNSEGNVLLLREERSEIQSFSLRVQIPMSRTQIAMSNTSNYINFKSRIRVILRRSICSHLQYCCHKPRCSNARLHRFGCECSNLRECLLFTLGTVEIAQMIRRNVYKGSVIVTEDCFLQNPR